MIRRLFVPILCTILLAVTPVLSKDGGGGNGGGKGSDGGGKGGGGNGGGKGSDGGKGGGNGNSGGHGGGKGGGGKGGDSGGKGSDGGKGGNGNGGGKGSEGGKGGGNGGDGGGRGGSDGGSKGSGGSGGGKGGDSGGKGGNGNGGGGKSDSGKGGGASSSGNGSRGGGEGGQSGGKSSGSETRGGGGGSKSSGDQSDSGKGRGQGAGSSKASKSDSNASSEQTGQSSSQSSAPSRENSNRSAAKSSGSPADAKVTTQRSPIGVTSPAQGKAQAIAPAPTASIPRMQALRPPSLSLASVAPTIELTPTVLPLRTARIRLNRSGAPGDRYLPEALSPVFLGTTDALAQLPLSLELPLKARRAPLPVSRLVTANSRPVATAKLLRECRLTIASSALKYGLVHLDVQPVDNGTAEGDGYALAIMARATYEQDGLQQVRQSEVVCHLDRAARVIALDAPNTDVAFDPSDTASIDDLVAGRSRPFDDGNKE